MTKARLRIASNLTLPHETQTSTLLVLGGKGMGKTNLGRVIVEEFSRAGLRWAALDPLGVWWGLRYSKDGKGRGIECLILGGVHADMPIEPTGGAVVADLVVDESISVIIDFSRKPSGEMWGIGEKTRFLTDYARRLYQRQGELVDGHRREPIFQLLDEAARYVPQIIPHGNPDLAKCLSAWETLVEEGRNIGIGVGLLTQRSARINKSVSELADALFAFRTVGPNSVEAVTDWLGAHVPKDKIKAHIETLRSLERGRCLVVSPGWLQFEGIADIRAGETFDSSATPKPGERQAKVHGAGAKPDLAKYQERMRETIERAKENDPRALRAQIQQMRAELAKRQLPAISHQPSAQVDAAKVQRQIDTQVYRAQKDRDAQWNAAVKLYQRDLIEKLREISAAQLKTIREIVPFHFVPPDFIPPISQANAPAPLAIAPPLPKPLPTHRTDSAPVLQPRKIAQASAQFADAPKKAERAILAVLAQHGVASKIKLAVMTGYAVTGGGFNNALGRSRVQGWIEGTDPIQITPAGSAALGEYEPLPSGTELLRCWLANVKKAESAVLDRLARHPAHTMGKAELAQATGYEITGGGFNNALRRLRTMQLISGMDPLALCSELAEAADGSQAATA